MGYPIHLKENGVIVFTKVFATAEERTAYIARLQSKFTYEEVTEGGGSFSGDLDDISEGTTNKHFTSTEKTKLSGIEAGAEVNVNADWNSSSGDSQILNKPSIPTVSDTAYDATSWNANTDAPTKNAVRDKIESLDAAKANLAGANFTGNIRWNSALSVTAASTTWQGQNIVRIDASSEEASVDLQDGSEALGALVVIVATNVDNGLL